jgi:pyrroloquinoline quinone (PQQ) biosynthesis protein C
MEQNFIQSLNDEINRAWREIKNNKFWKFALNNEISKEFYYDLMIEIHHYTRHNSMNQAATAFVEAPEGLYKFVYSHAAEELGHERMVIHDLEGIGLLNKADLLREPLPATEALISYLYFVALKYGPIARLGYSFWAENVYLHIDELIQKIRKDLSLADKNLTFFIAHAKIDIKHSAQVEECIQKYARTPEAQNLVRRVAKTTLFLTAQMLDQVAQQHMQL